MELGGARTELGSICHSTSDPTELVNTTTSVSYCPTASVTSPTVSTKLDDQVEFATPLDDDADRLDAYYNGEPLRYSMMVNICSNHSPPPPYQHLFADLHLTHTSEPANFAEVKDDPAWRAAMEQELKAVEQNYT
jgi:hypothetical protein